MSSNKAYMIGN